MLVAKPLQKCQPEINSFKKLVVHLFYDNIANPYFNSIKVVTPLFSFCFVLLCFVLFF